LKHGEEAGGARDGQGRRAELAKELMPLGNSQAFTRRLKGVKDGMELGDQWGGSSRASATVSTVPAQHPFAVCPGGSASLPHRTINRKKNHKQQRRFCGYSRI
jgi:hypothetical protein